MDWDTYYEKFYDWATSTQISRMSSLTSFGASSEVAEIAQEYMDEKAAALYCSIPIQSLQKKRHLGHGPVYIKDGTKVLYARKDLERYMEQRKVKTCDR